jgi:hypothetical protein
MPTLENVELGIKLTLPDKWTFRQTLSYDSYMDWRKGKDLYDRLWMAAKSVIVKLESPNLVLDLDLDGEYNPALVEPMKWVALAVYSVRMALDEIPKNS